MEIYERIWKLLICIICGTQDSSISFSDLQKVLTVLGFVVFIKGDHFIYIKDGIDEIINIQSKGNKASEEYLLTHYYYTKPQSYN